MSPAPVLVVGRKGVRLEHLDAGQRLATVGTLEFLGACNVGVFEHEKSEPGPKPVTTGSGGRIAPGEILVVEFNESEVVRLEIGNPGDRFGADHHLRVDSNNVARPD